MGIVYVNGRLVRETDEEKKARIEAAAMLAAAQRSGTEKANPQWEKMRMMDSAATKNMQKAGVMGTEPTAKVGANAPSVSLKTGNVIKSPAQAKADAAVASDKTLKEAQDRALAYASGMQAIADYKANAEAAKTAAQGRIADVYDPQKTDIENERARQLAMLESMIGQGQTDITKAEQDFLANVQPTNTFANTQFVNMQALQNPLLEALRQQGAGEGAVQQQSAMDQSLNNFMTQLQQQSASRYGDVQNNLYESLRNSGRGAAAAGRQYLAQRGPEISSGIQSAFGKQLTDLGTNRANTEGDIMSQYADALAKIAELQAETTAKYAPRKKKAGSPSGVSETRP
ncbi:hypothetical protein UFOVP1549_24 [uncultured Caudovirales phage]|uniref:Uncharacterized protein n=1 Tax=uncultured Caudovirales phage TaxID=2100421 RepID=A0A6J7XF76_9CAUD|nr:hypothetical protein UFOVP303_9 [uncultured Caudovirales phage]CAB5228512.1 hypothetical protein UFOVP1549_24 [uncultured Caudovirales phage]